MRWSAADALEFTKDTAYSVVILDSGHAEVCEGSFCVGFLTKKSLALYLKMGGIVRRGV